MWNVLTVITLVPLSIILLFTVSILPVWCLINCITSKDISNKFKPVWIGIVVLLWSLGSVIYGSFISPSKRLRVVSRVCLGFVILLFGSFLSWIPAFSTGQASKFLNKLDSIEYASVSADETQNMKSSIRILSEEFQEHKFSINNFRKRYQLLKIIQELTKDNKLTKAEYDGWIKLFDSREYLDTDELVKYEMRLKFVQP